jgi:hypothetical protein
VGNRAAWLIGLLKFRLTKVVEPNSKAVNDRGAGLVPEANKAPFL